MNHSRLQKFAQMIRLAMSEEEAFTILGLPFAKKKFLTKDGVKMARNKKLNDPKSDPEKVHMAADFLLTTILSDTSKTKQEPTKYEMKGAKSEYEKYLASQISQNGLLDTLNNEFATLSNDSQSKQESEDKIKKLDVLNRLAVSVNFGSLSRKIYKLIKKEKSILDIWKIKNAEQHIINELNKIKNPNERIAKSKFYEDSIMNRVQDANSVQATQILQDLIDAIINIKSEATKEQAHYLLQSEKIDALRKELEITDLTNSKALEIINKKYNDIKSEITYDDLRDALETLYKDYFAKEKVKVKSPNEKLEDLLREVENRRRQSGDIKKNPKTDKFTVFRGFGQSEPSVEMVEPRPAGQIDPGIEAEVDQILKGLGYD